MSTWLRACLVALAVVFGFAAVEISATAAAHAAHSYDGFLNTAAESPVSLSATLVADAPDLQTTALRPSLASVMPIFAAEGGAGSSSVNPLNGTNNCVNCAIAGDATLAGARASALDSATPQPLSILEGAFGNSFQPVSGQAQIEQDLLASGSGSRGIVFGSRGLQAGRVFNAVNQGGVIRFIDFQSGGAASFQGYQGYYFLRTTP